MTDTRSRQETLARLTRAVTWASAGVAVAIFLGVSGWVSGAFAWFTGDDGGGQSQYSSSGSGDQGQGSFSNQYFSGSQPPVAGSGQPQARTGNS